MNILNRILGKSVVESSFSKWTSHKVYSTHCLDSPWLMLPPSFKGGDMVYNFYSLADNKVLSFNKRQERDEKPILSPDDDTEIVGSSHGWLALFNERNCDLFLSNPLTRRHVKLPPIHNLPIPQQNLSGGYGCVFKLIISCSPHEDECRAMMSFGCTDRLAFCSPARPTTEWTPIGAALRKPLFEGDEPTDARPYEDFVYSARHNLFFCLTKLDSDDLESWDLKDPDSPRINWFDESMLKYDYCRWFEQKHYCRQLRYLVFSEQSDQLFLVTSHLVEQMAPDGSCVEFPDSTKYPYKTIGFDVHEIDREGGRRLRHMEGCLDGMAMFVGHNHSFLISGAGAAGIRPNCIYFTDDGKLTPPTWEDEEMFGGHDVGIFDYESKTISPCYYPCDLKSLTRIMPAPIWFTPSLH